MKSLPDADKPASSGTPDKAARRGRPRGKRGNGEEPGQQPVRKRRERSRGNG